MKINHFSTFGNLKCIMVAHKDCIECQNTILGSIDIILDKRQDFPVYNKPGSDHKKINIKTKSFQI